MAERDVVSALVAKRAKIAVAVCLSLSPSSSKAASKIIQLSLPDEFLLLT